MSLDTALPAPPVPTVEGVLARSHRALTIGLLALVSLSAFEALAVGAVMPVVARDLDGLPLYALAFATPVATALMGMVLAGSWADARGPAGPVRAGTALFAAGLLTGGLAPTMPVLLVGRAVQGVGSGLLGVALYVAVGRCYPDELRPKLLAAYSAAWVLPGLAGPGLAGLVAERLGWRWAFLAVAVLAPAAALPVLARLRSAPSPLRRRMRVLTPALAWAVLAGAAVCLLQVVGAVHGTTDTPFVVLLATVAVVLVVVSGRRLMPPGTFRLVRGLPAVVALRGAAGAAFASADVFVPLYLVRERGLPVTGAGLVTTLGKLNWFGGSWLKGRLAAPRRRPLLLRAGVAAIALGTLGTGTMLAAGAPTALIVAGWPVTAFGMGLALPVLALLAMDLATARQQGAAGSALQLADALFASVGITLAGAVFGALLAVAPAAAYLSAFALSGSVAVAAVALAPRVRPRFGGQGGR